jgi:hypothetical protein
MISLRFLAPALCAALLFSQDAGRLERRFRNPPDDARIMMRWWWFGPAVTHAQLEAEMRRMKEGGIGGFEVQPVYPLALDDAARGIRNLRYLSPEFLDAVAFTARQARELGLRMDMTLGSGWPYGGPHIGPELAAPRLRAATRPDLKEGERLVAEFPGRFYVAGLTGQQVKRAAFGAEGYVLDHYSEAAIAAHLREVGEKLVSAAGPGAIHAAFCDSLEVYGSDWPRDMLEQFQKRRGYDLKPLINALDTDIGERTAAIRRDFGRTLTELYEERFLVPLAAWTRAHKLLLRVQNYGIPPASISSARHVDLPEGEGWHYRTLTTARWAASAGHLFGRPVISSETWTWIHSPAFRATPLDVKAEADQHFLSGINQLVGHGWPYSPPYAGQPGWSFYAAGVFNDHNPWWPVMPDLARYLQRVSFLLRQGAPVADVALYAPTEDAWSTFTLGRVNLWQQTAAWIGPETTAAILDAGFNFDAIDDGTLEVAGSRYPILVLPGVRFMPETTRAWIQRYTASGGKVINAGKDLAQQLAAARQPDVVLTPAASEIGFVHRKLPDAEIYFLANTANRARRVEARFRDASRAASLWDPLTGETTALPLRNGAATLDFEPYASRIVVFGRGAGKPAAAPAATLADLSTGWTVRFENGPEVRMDTLRSWTADAGTRFFSGKAVYSRQAEVPAAAAGARLWLDLGEAKPAEKPRRPGGRDWAPNIFMTLVEAPVREAAEVFVNGQRAGSVWAPPYRVEVTGLVKAGSNRIEIAVYNTAINQMAGAPRPDYKPLAARYGERFQMQDMDDLEPVASGLTGPIRLLSAAAGPPSSSR